MDPHAERWPHPSVVAKELRRLQAEKAVSEWNTKQAFITELKQHMSGYDKTRTRIERRISMRLFTQRMLRIGERIINELENGGASPN
jgi:hypothetical protein